MKHSSRIKPPLSLDNAWWWESAAEGKLGIQQCSSCGVLRHPPRPMCSECRSSEWEVLESSGQGTVISYTVIHEPKFPGYSYPLIIVVAELAEGTRLVAELKDCEPEDASFGMPVTAFIHEDEDGFKVPMFRPTDGEK